MTVGVAFQFVPGQMGTDYEPVYVAQGGRLFLVGADPLGAHAITSYDTYPDGLPLFDTIADGQPLFDTDQAAAGQVVEVFGVPSLQPGAYPFFCRNHFGMDGLLTVQP